MTCKATLIWILIAVHQTTAVVHLAYSNEEISKPQKLEFLQAICEGLENSPRCMSSGTLAIDLSINWVMFEACSYSGGRKTMAKCFDRATKLAGEMTGDERYAENIIYCHRFKGDEIDDAIVRCYREGFKYSDIFINNKYNMPGRR